METYNGQVRTPQDAIILFEACRLGLLPRVQRRLSEKERQSIRSGSVFVWDEREAGMRRWTDGKSWSASRVSGSFLTYREMEGKRGGNSFPPHAPSGKTLESGRNSADDQNQQGEAEEGPDGYRYKPDGLMKQSFSITTSQGQHLHLISYFARAHATNTGLQQPSCDPTLRSIRPQKGMYPESSVNDQSTVPAVTRSPMMGAPGYTMAPQTPAYHQSSQPPPGYIPAGYAQHGGFQYPPSPMNAPQYHYPMHHYPQGPSGLPLPGYPPGPYAPPQMSQPPPQHYDQRPIRTPENGLPPPSQQQQHQHQHHQHQQQHQHQHQQQQGLAPPQMSQPPISQHNGASAYLQAPTLQYEQPPPPPGRQSPSEQAAAALQIDPRLMGASAPSANPGSIQLADLKEDSQNEARENPRSTSASQAPTITSLVNGSAATPTAEKTDSAESTGEETGGTSPGGTKQTTSIQDIPSEKLGFREDKRALRQLDKVFAV